MRVTLILDDDLARHLHQEARHSGKSFKEVVNTLLRRGLGRGDEPLDPLPPFRVEPKACGFRSGIDPEKLNQLGV